MKNLKDKITNWCAIISIICAAVMMTGGLSDILPSYVMPVMLSINAIAGGISRVLIGKNDDISTKSEGQLSQKQPNM